MKTQYYVAASLDGFIADANDSLEWLFQLEGEGPGEDYSTFLSEVGAIAMGSRTYEWILRHDDWPYELPTWVFTRRSLVKPDGATIHFTQSDVCDPHRQMVEAADGKNVWLVGGGDLVGQFHDHGLLDELIVHLAPVTLGRGMPLLPRAIMSPPMQLLSVVPKDGGMVRLQYQVSRADV